MTKEQEDAIRILEAQASTKVKENHYLIFHKEATVTVLNMLKEKDAKIEHLEEKRNNQKAELTILNEKQKEMNKLINTVRSYKGMFKRQQKDQEKKDKIIDLMARAIDNYDSQLVINTFKDKEHVKQYFEKLAERKSKNEN